MTTWPDSRFRRGVYNQRTSCIIWSCNTRIMLKGWQTWESTSRGLSIAVREILYSDYSGLRGAEYEAAVDETVEEVLKLPDGATAPSITNVKGTSMSPATAAKGREVVALVKKKNLKGPTVLVGVSGLVGSVVGLLQIDVHMAKTLEEAKEWVVTHPE